METRQAELTDLQDIIDLNKIDDYGNPDDFIWDSIKNWRVFVAETNNTIVWFSLYQVIWGNTPFLALVKVHPKYQNKWYWSALVGVTENRLKDNDFSSLTSSTEEKNTGAQNFHESLGFTKIWVLTLPHGREVFYRKEL